MSFLKVIIDFSATELSQKVVKAAGLYVAYAAGMTALALISLLTSVHLAKMVAAEVASSAASQSRIVSRVEKRLKQMAISRNRPAREPHPEVLAYAVPKIHPAALAQAMDRTEHPAVAAPSADVVASVSLPSPADTRAVAMPAVEGGSEGPRVAGYFVVARAEGAAADAGTANDAMFDGGPAIPDDAQMAESEKARKSMAGKLPAGVRKKPLWIATEELSLNEDGLRLAETPGAIIRRQLGGTT